MKGAGLSIQYNDERIFGRREYLAQYEKLHELLGELI
jgi:hypothetical protein